MGVAAGERVEARGEFEETLAEWAEEAAWRARLASAVVLATVAGGDSE